MIVFETARAVVRQLEEADFAPFYAICADPLVMRMMGDGHPLPAEQVRRWIVKSQQNYATYGYGCWAVVERQSAALVGFCGLVHPGGSPRVELIYALRPDYWGRGLATEIVRGALEVGFHVYGLARIVATVDPQNQASLRVLRKLGLAQVGEELDEEGLPTLVYAVERRRDA